MLTALTGRVRRLWPVVIAEMGQALQSGAERLLLLTPDQYTLQAELELIDRLQLPGLLQMEVLSPSRFLLRIFALAGSPKRVRIDARGKAMVLADVLRLSRRDLQLYGSAVERSGLVERLSSCIADLKRSGMSPADVAALAQNFESPHDSHAKRSSYALHAKLSDIALLYARYEERLEGAFLDGEDVQEALLERLPSSGFLENTKIWIYGFDLISPQFLRQIAVMARHAVSVRLALTLDDTPARKGTMYQSALAPKDSFPKNSKVNQPMLVSEGSFVADSFTNRFVQANEDSSVKDSAVYQPMRDTLTRLSHYFDAECMEWRLEHVVDPLVSTSAICHLESELFAFPILPYKGEPDGIMLWSASTPYEEAMRVAEKVCALAREGMRFDEMAVVVGDVNSYTGPIESAFGRSGIPYHLVRQKRALSHPLLHGWLAALRCATHGFRMEDAIDWLKSGFSGLSQGESGQLENYVIEHGIRGNKWRRIIDNGTMETLRRRFMTPLVTLHIKMQEAKDMHALLIAAYSLLEDVQAYKTLLIWQQQLTERGLLTEAAHCSQSWRLLLETLDQLHTLSGADKPSMAGLSQMLEAGLSMADLGAVPAWPGMLQVGQLGHVKLGSGYRAVFLLGMQDGITQGNASGLLTDAEAMDALAYTGLDAAFGLTGDALSQLKQVNLLDTLAASSEQLFISHALSETTGEAQRPAMVLKLLQHVFPKLKEMGGFMQSVYPLHAKGVAVDALGSMLQEAAKRKVELTEEQQESVVWLLHHEQTRKQAEQVLRALLEPSQNESLSRQMAYALYAKSRTSASRLETFALCPFRHFMVYGLRPIPRREFAVARDETGTFYHRAMEGYTVASASIANWPNVSRMESDAIMNAVLAPLCAEWESKPLGDNAMLRAQGDAFCRIVRRAAWTYADQTRRGRFCMGAVEARFGRGEVFPAMMLSLQDGNPIWLEGRIDRIDFLHEDGKQWLRVVDYKSGRAELDASKVHGGVQMQLLLYLQAALYAFPGVSAAGAFYAQFRDPLIEIESDDVDEIDRQIAKQLALTGIQVADASVVRALENANEYLKKDGMLSQRKFTATPKQIDGLLRYAQGLATSFAKRISTGEMMPRPAQLPRWKACTYCEYGCVCRFDTQMYGHMPRLLASVSKKELLDKVCNTNPNLKT